ncbi:MAG: endonuclease [Nannocystales bacterium]
MTFTYTMRHIATSLALGLCVGAAACGGEPAKSEADAESKAKAEPAPKPAPEPVVQAEPEPPPKTLPKTLASLDEVIAAAVEIHSQHRRTFYCNCAYTPQLRIARGTCGYKTRADESLSKRVAWDHVVPNRAFGEHRSCWREPICQDEAGVAFSGVRCCREVDEEFRAMELDLQNLVPAVGELQADRSDFDFGELEGETRMYGACDFEVDRSLRRAEPDEDTRGEIARAYLYMQDTYGDGLPLTEAERTQFEAWHEADPPNAWEVQRNRRVAAVQGISNSFLPMMAPAGDEDVEPERAGAPTNGGAAKAPAAKAPAQEAPAEEAPAKAEPEGGAAPENDAGGAEPVAAPGAEPKTAG